MTLRYKREGEAASDVWIKEIVGIGGSLGVSSLEEQPNMFFQPSKLTRI